MKIVNSITLLIGNLFNYSWMPREAEPTPLAILLMSISILLIPALIAIIIIYFLVSKNKIKRKKNTILIGIIGTIIILGMFLISQLIPKEIRQYANKDFSNEEVIINE